MRTANLRRRPSPGFTLLEILITCALVGLVLTLVAAALIAAVRNARGMEQRARLQVELARVASQIRFQLLAVNVSPVRQYPLVGTSNGVGLDEIDFVTSDLIQTAGIGDVSYRMIMGPHGEPALGYREHPFVYPDGAVFDPGPYKMLSSAITGLTCEYKGPTGWQKSWQQPEPPQDVRVTLKTRQGPFSVLAEPTLEELNQIGSHQ
ncbi:MAG: PulJ/GspJ family protein [Candidatus Xenobia bacterium]